MTATSHPARLSARHSCQTRRSKGTERFSTRMRALPGNADVPGLTSPRGGIGQPREVDDQASVRLSESLDRLRAAGADDADLRMGEHLSSGLGKKRGEMRDVLLDVLPVRPDEVGERDRGIVDAKVEPFAEKLLGQLDERALA